MIITSQIPQYKDMSEGKMNTLNQINFFESIEVMEPRCPGCEVKLEYGVNTRYNDRAAAHVCNECRTVLK